MWALLTHDGWLLFVFIGMKQKRVLCYLHGNYEMEDDEEKDLSDLSHYLHGEKNN